jgi:hypothetical protein
MYVIAKSTSKRLIKGSTYEVDKLFNSGTNQNRWMEGRIVLKEVKGWFRVTQFTDVNGNDVPRTDINNVMTTFISDSAKFEELKVGDIIVCKTDNYKTLVNGGYYKIESLDTKTKQVQSWTGNNYTSSENKIKFVGVKRVMKYNSWNFRKMTTQELRDANLNELLNNEKLNVIDKPISRKLDYSENPDLDLIKSLAMSILDPNRHKLSIIDWACEKHDRKLGIQNKDFERLLELPLKDLLELIETNK